MAGVVVHPGVERIASLALVAAGQRDGTSCGSGGDGHVISSSDRRDHGCANGCRSIPADHANGHAAASNHQLDGARGSRGTSEREGGGGRNAGSIVDDRQHLQFGIGIDGHRGTDHSREH
ncbi:hypothetical protein D3C86_1879420 [compost metagenome]